MDEPQTASHDLDALRGEVARLAARVAELEREAGERLPRRLRAFIEASPFGCHLYRLHDDDRLVFFGANPAATRILRVDNRPFVGRTIEDAFPALAGGPIPDAYRAVARTGEPFETELVHYTEGDIAGAFEVSAFRIAPHLVAALFRDVTERARAEHQRHRAEEALRASERRFRALIQHSSDLVSLHDANGRWIYQSPAATRVLGYTEGEQIGRTPFEYFHPDDVAPMRARLVELLGSPGTLMRQELRFRHADGGWRHLDSVAQNLLEDPDVGAVLITSRDVTEQRVLHDELVQAQKMECVGRLAAGVAHDFNNVLTVILGCADLVAGCDGLDADARGALEEVIAAAQQGAALSSRLLAFSRRETTVRRAVCVGSEIRAAERMLRRALPSRVELILEAAADPLPVLGDPAQLLQVLVNLAINAGDAMPGGGRLRVTAALDDAQASHARLVGHVPPPPRVAITVRDTGSGIPADALAHLFEPFFTTKEAGRGTGLGLSICLGIVQQHRGAIGVDSEPGLGTTFTVYLPALDRPQP